MLNDMLSSLGLSSNFDETVPYIDWFLKGLFTLACMRLGFFFMAYFTTSAVPPAPPRDINAPSGPIKEPLGLEEYRKVLASAADNQLVCVDYWATWCGPCIAAAPFFAALAAEHTDVLFVKVEDCESRDVIKSAGINGFPTFRFFVNGKCVQQVLGGDKKAITKIVETLKVAAKRGDPIEELLIPQPEGGCVIM